MSRATSRTAVVLLCLSMADSEGARFRRSPRWLIEAVGFEHAEQVAGDVTFEAALDLARSLAFGGAFGGVGTGRGVVLQAGQHDGVQRAVELAVTAAVEAVSDGLPGGRGDGCCATEHRERAVAADTPRM